VLLLFVNRKCLLQKEALQSGHFKRMPGTKQGISKVSKILIDNYKKKSCRVQLELQNFQLRMPSGAQAKQIEPGALRNY